VCDGTREPKAVPHRQRLRARRLREQVVEARDETESDASNVEVCVLIAPARYWAGVAGGGSGFASVRTSFIFPVRSSNTCRLGTILQLN
jgi:hypothetical protein